MTARYSKDSPSSARESKSTWRLCRRYNAMFSAPFAKAFRVIFAALGTVVARLAPFSTMALSPDESALRSKENIKLRSSSVKYEI